METVTVTLDLPRNLLGALDVPEVRIDDHVRELVAIELVREGRISTGKGAEILGMSKWSFILLLAERGLNYFSESTEELTAQIGELDLLLGQSGS
ncbi:MAG: UPF0175 family protein [Halieaceae bacterium]|nr:UPF0175 family protein [Halieaceae bacterium]